MITTIYSKPKVGKTTFAVTDCVPNKTAIINADKGLVGIDTSGMTVVDDVSIGNLNSTVLTDTFLRKHDRIIIDTATSLYEAFLMEVSGDAPPSQKNFGQANTAFSTLLRQLRHSAEVIVLCQEKVVRPTEDWVSDDDDEETASSVTVDLPPGAAKTLLTMSDVIGRLYMANVDGKLSRRLWLTPTPNIVAGARSATYSNKPPYLPRPTMARLNKLLGWK